jgi:uncharacterized protein with HEPN domain
MRKKPKILIEHILEYIGSIEEYLSGISKEEFLSSREKQDALLEGSRSSGRRSSKFRKSLRSNTKKSHGEGWRA